MPKNKKKKGIKSRWWRYKFTKDDVPCVSIVTFKEPVDKIDAVLDFKEDIFNKGKKLISVEDWS